MRHFRKILRVLLCACLFCASLTGCTKAKNQAAYTVYPVGYLIERLGNGLVEAVSVQESGSVVQRAQVKDNFQVILENSDVFFHIGNLEPYLTVYSEEISASKVTDVDLSTLNAVYDFQRYTRITSTDGAVTWTEEPWYNSEVFDTVDMDAKDLYLWTDPIAMLSMAGDIRDWLVKSYPDDASLVNERYEELKTDLINLDAQYQSLAQSLVNNGQVIKFASITASFGNWQKTYGFQVYPIMLSKYGALPSEEQLAAIKERLIADNVKYIVYEPDLSEDMIALYDSLQEELGLSRVELSNLPFPDEEEEDEAQDYLSVMYENYSNLEIMKESAE